MGSYQKVAQSSFPDSSGPEGMPVGKAAINGHIDEKPDEIVHVSCLRLRLAAGWGRLPTAMPWMLSLQQSG